MSELEAARSTIAESLCRAADLCEDSVQRAGNAIELILDVVLDQGLAAHAVIDDLGRLDLATMFVRHRDTCERLVERNLRASTHMRTVSETAEQLCREIVLAGEQIAETRPRNRLVVVQGGRSASPDQQPTSAGCAELGASAAALARELLDDLLELEALERVSDAGVVELVGDVSLSMDGVERTAAATAGRLGELAELAESRVQGLLRLTRRCLSLLQFQDPLCQELRAVAGRIATAIPQTPEMGVLMSRCLRADGRLAAPVSEASLALEEVARYYRGGAQLGDLLTNELHSPRAGALSHAVSGARHTLGAHSRVLVSNCDDRQARIRKAVARCRRMVDVQTAMQAAGVESTCRDSADRIDAAIRALLEQLAGLAAEAERCREATLAFSNDVAGVLAHAEARVRGAEHALRTAVRRDVDTRQSVEVAARDAVEHLDVEEAYHASLDRADRIFGRLGQRPVDLDPVIPLDSGAPADFAVGAGELLLF